MNASPKLRILAAGLLVSGWLGTTACDKLGLGDDSPTTPSPLPTDTPVAYAAVGASDVWGIGSSSPCFILLGDCPDGKGYVFVAARDLRSRGYTVSVTNLGFPAATISRRFQDLGQQYGHAVPWNLIENGVQFVPTQATVVTVFTGANDVNVITAALGGGAGGSNPTAYIDQQVQNFATDYMSLLNGIRSRAPSARIIALNVPNLGGLLYLAGASLPQRQAAQRASVGMTRNAINTLVSQGVRIVDLMCMAALYQPSSLSADGFHPSDAGYALIANDVVRAITAASFPAPQSSCPQMTLVP